MHLKELLSRRILQERERLGFSQHAAACATGVRREMWAKYEAGSEPGAQVLAAMAAAGADVQYILTGHRQGQGIGESAVHQAVLDALDLLSLSNINAHQLARIVAKLAAKSATLASACPPTSTVKNQQVFHSEVGQMLKVEGNLDQRHFNFRSTQKKRC